jgi:hypothetical protein
LDLSYLVCSNSTWKLMLSCTISFEVKSKGMVVLLSWLLTVTLLYH